MQFVLLASLWWLQDHERRQPTQTQLAEQAGVDPMMTSQVARKLEARGLLERRAGHADSRARQLRLTPSGRVALTAALADVEAADEAHFHSLGDQLPTFAAALTLLDSHNS